MGEDESHDTYRNNLKQHLSSPADAPEPLEDFKVTSFQYLFLSFLFLFIRDNQRLLRLHGSKHAQMKQAHKVKCFFGETICISNMWQGSQVDRGHRS